MGNALPELLPVLIVIAGFAAGFYVRHNISVKRQKGAKQSFFKQV